MYYFSVYVCVKIRKDYYDENIKAGPQSRILEGVTWEEAQKIRVCDLFSVFVIYCDYL